MTDDPTGSPAYLVLNRAARRVLRAIEQTIGDRGYASISYADFSADHHIGSYGCRQV